MKGLRVTVAMVAVECLEVGLNTLVKAADSTKGMSTFVFVVYSNALALLFLLPSTFIFHRKYAPPPITISIICRILLLSFLSCSVQTLLYIGIGYSSPILSSAMVNLSPAFTFLVAIISRMEKLELKFKSGLAKSIGTVVSIAGALIVTLYKGMPVTSGSFQNNILIGALHSEWVLAGFLLAVSTFCLSILYVVQTWVLKDYPAELMVTTTCCTFVTILTGIVALVAVKDPTQWIFRFEMEWMAVIYSAFFLVSIRSVVFAWACRKMGPLYVAMFKPLEIVIALAMGVIFLGEAIYLGSMVGAVTIAFGFYGVLWGMSNEVNITSEGSKNSDSLASSSTAPLLQERTTNL